MSDQVADKNDLFAGVLDIDTQKVVDALQAHSGATGFVPETGEPIVGEGIFDLAREALGVSKKEVQKVRNLDQAFTAANTYLYGTGAIDMMQNHPHITQLTVEDIDMQGASMSMLFDRTRKPKDFAEIGYTSRAGQNKGCLGKVRKTLGNLAAETFS